MSAAWKPTEFQVTCIGLLNGAPTGSLTVGEAAWKLARLFKRRTGTYRLAFTAAMRGLEKRGYAVSYRRGDDQWAGLAFALTPEGRTLTCFSLAPTPEHQP